jgi:hypothetical protein
MSNLSKYHREHEKYYSQAPLHTAVEIQSASKTLKTLADKWSNLKRVNVTEGTYNRYMACEDLNEDAAIQYNGLLFMEGEAEPSEMYQLKQRLDTISKEQESAGEWLSKAMESSWESGIQLIKIPGLEDVLGERHRIITNNWQAAHLSILMAKLISRALLVLQEIDFSPKSIREDIAAANRYPDLLYSASEMLDRAADLSAEFALLVHDSERRWRTFRKKVMNLMGDSRHIEAETETRNGD